MIPSVVCQTSDDLTGFFSTGGLVHHTKRLGFLCSICKTVVDKSDTLVPGIAHHCRPAMVSDIRHGCRWLVLSNLWLDCLCGIQCRWIVCVARLLRIPAVGHCSKIQLVASSVGVCHNSNRLAVADGIAFAVCLLFFNLFCLNLKTRAFLCPLAAHPCHCVDVSVVDLCL